MISSGIKNYPFKIWGGSSSNNPTIEMIPLPTRIKRNDGICFTLLKYCHSLMSYWTTNFGCLNPLKWRDLGDGAPQWNGSCFMGPHRNLMLVYNYNNNSVSKSKPTLVMITNLRIIHYCYNIVMFTNLANCAWWPILCRALEADWNHYSLFSGSKC